jgi:Fic family protein
MREENALPDEEKAPKFSSPMRRTAYIWQRPGWPALSWKADALLPLVASARRRQGYLLGALSGQEIEIQQRAQLDGVTEEVVTTSAIEGEQLDVQSVRSSVARHLGFEDHAPMPADARVDGIVEVVLDAVRNAGQPLTKKRLHGWHTSLFPAGLSGRQKIRVGAWRKDEDGPMRVVSGVAPHERIHYQAPPAARVPDEMNDFLAWFARPDEQVDGLIRAALAHLWFVTIHPYDDGNGRLARAITELVVAQDEAGSPRFYSISARIRHERARYYDALEQAQKGDLDVTEWIAWFIGCYERAIQDSEKKHADALARTRFWATHEASSFNERQRKVLNRLLVGWEGKLTAKKYGAAAHTSPATAQRDINDLLERGVLVRNPGSGKLTSYTLA